MILKAFQKSAAYDYIEERLGPLPGTERSFLSLYQLPGRDRTVEIKW